MVVITDGKGGALLSKGPMEARLSVLCGSLGPFRDRAWSQERHLLDKQLPHQLLTAPSVDNAKKGGINGNSCFVKWARIFSSIQFSCLVMSDSL